MASVTGLLVAIVAIIGTHAVSPPHLAHEDAGPGSSIDTKAWDESAAKAEAFVSQLTLDEKIKMVTGNPQNSQGCIGNIDPIPRLGFKGLCMLDGPQAVNRVDGISVFPSGVSIGASWDRDLIYQRGIALGEEFRDKGGHVMLGPSTGPLGRHPLGGRNWEGFAADPYLGGVAMGLTIQGVQSVGVQTCAKHYIANEQETQRTRTTMPDGRIVEAVSSDVDDRTLHELYLWPFADAVRAGTTSFMCGYNRVNEEYACASQHLLNRILRDELGFRGYVVSDWYATHGTSEYASAGLDMEMPGEPSKEAEAAGAAPAYFGRRLLKAVEAGNVTQQRLDQMVAAIMTPYYLMKQDRVEYPSVDPSSFFSFLFHELGWNSSILESSPVDIRTIPIPPARVVRGEHPALIRQMGAAGTVLLKNTGNILPFQQQGLRNIGVFGNDAMAPTDGLTYLTTRQELQSVNYLDTNPTGFEYGTLDIGGGSGTGRHFNLVAPLDAIKARAAETGARVQYLGSNDLLAQGDFRTIFPKPEVCLVFLKSWAAEGRDRPSFEADWNSTVVVNNVADFCNNTIVVTHSGGVNTMPWADHPHVKAILAAHLPGEETGNAIVDVLWGDAEPSGRLPYTIPADEADYDIPVTDFTNQDVGRYGWHANYTEGLMIDYRHFDSMNIKPRFAFGFGLGYSTFDFVGGLALTKSCLLDAGFSAIPDPGLANSLGGNPDLWKTLIMGRFSVKNIGKTAGAVVPQLYLSFPQDHVPPNTPVKVLRGFAKKTLQPGEVGQFKFPLMRRDLSYWDTKEQTWRVPKGNFTFQLGFSSQDLRTEVKTSILRV